ncbi:unnamed protein product [Gordionus sp. m RMFG-2023]
MDYIRDLPVLLRHAIGEFFSVSGLAFVFRARMVLCFLGAALYLLSPFDALPEAVFGILGFLDDAVVLLLVAVYATVAYRQTLTARQNSQDNSESPTENNFDQDSLSLINNFHGGDNLDRLNPDPFNRYLFESSAEPSGSDENGNDLLRWFWGHVGSHIASANDRYGYDDTT